MLRQLLTLMAVITGLTMVAEPARAAEASVVSAAQASESADCIVIIQRPLQFSRDLAANRLTAKPCNGPKIIIWAPSVVIRVDRSHE